MGNKISKDEFKTYLCLQKSGLYNMITEGSLCASIIGIDPDQYSDLLENYSKYSKEYNLSLEDISEGDIDNALKDAEEIEVTLLKSKFRKELNKR